MPAAQLAGLQPISTCLGDWEWPMAVQRRQKAACAAVHGSMSSLLLQVTNLPILTQLMKKYSN